MTATTKSKMIKGSAPVKGENEDRKYFNLQKLSLDTGISQDKLYNNMKGIYDSLTDAEKKAIAVCLMGPVKNFYGRLGMIVTFNKAPEK